MGFVFFLIILFFAYLPVLKENIYWKTHPISYFVDGTPMYMDRFGVSYVNGEKLVTHRLSNNRVIWVGAKTGTIYYDSKDPNKQVLWTEREKELMRAR